jgi:excisionase family DNA binding protein
VVTRPAEHLVHKGTSVVIDGRICAVLNKLLGLDRIRSQVRGQDPQLDQELLAIRLAGIAYESSAAGTVSAPRPEPVSQSHQQLNGDTVNTTTAATILGITDRAVRKAITEKRLKATQLDGRYRITREDLSAFMADR